MLHVEEQRGSFEGVGGVEIFYRRYRGVGSRASMVIAHGLGEHSGRYENVVETALPPGISVWAADHRGHGKSGGKRGHVSAFEEYLQDLGRFIRLVENEAPGRPVFLLGHSLGGLIALGFALRHGAVLDGLIVSSPALGMRAEVPPWKALMGRAMSAAWPSLALSNGLDASKISRDQEVVRRYLNDPLVHDRVTARWYTEFSKEIEAVNRRASELSLPLLMQLAGEDRLVDSAASEGFFKRLSVKDKTLYVYPGLYHEVYNEKKNERARVLKDLENWLKPRLPPA